MDYEKRLQDAGIRVTAVRLLVYRTVYEQMQNAFSLQNVMELLPHADSSSVFRALTPHEPDIKKRMLITTSQRMLIVNC